MLCSLPEINSLHALPSYIFKIQFNILLSSTLRSSKWSLSFMFHTTTMHAFLFPTYIPHALPISFTLFRNPSQALVKVANHAAPHYTIFATACYFSPLRLKYIPQPSVLEHPWPRPIFFTQCDWPSLKPKQNNRQTYNSVKFNLRNSARCHVGKQISKQISLPHGRDYENCCVLGFETV